MRFAKTKIEKEIERRNAMLSVVLPAYNEEKMIQKAADTLDRILGDAEIPYELVFVNDGSKDGTWAAIEAAAKKNPHVTGVCFSRNFGKESAMFAGLASASGECCAVMDCDLQHPPETLIEMYHLWEEGYEVIEEVSIPAERRVRCTVLPPGFFIRLFPVRSKLT